MNTATVNNFILTSTLVRFNKKLADAFEEHNQHMINK